MIIVSWYSRETTQNLFTLLHENDIEIDAGYIVRHRKLKNRFRHDYSLIYEDFFVQNIENSVLTLVCLSISREEVTERKEKEFFFESSSSGCNKYCTIGLPVSCSLCLNPPICILIPHFRLSEEKISFFELGKYINQLKASCEGKFSQAQASGSIVLPCEHQEIPVLVLPPNLISGTPTNYILYTQYKKTNKKPPMIRKSSRIKKA